MGIIRVMDPHLSNMIAAGEVVDRPVNIVKELVENSLDAGARSITIEVLEGGIRGITITDDGCGMDAQDAKLAFARHATSKLQTEEDLFNIQTMGFRGEALASIAAVAKVDMQTSNKGIGTHIRYEYGQLVEEERISCPRGTRIEVTGLFVHTPARFKYLKKAAYEFSIIAETVNKLAIAHPDVRLLLKHDGRTIFQTSGKGDKKEIMYMMFGRDAALNALPFYGESDDFIVEGLAVQPKINRANKHFIYITVNDRLVRNYTVVKAILEGYSEYLPKERFPLIFLNIRVDPQLVDVNVHPNKMEVRLAKEEYLSQLIINTLENLFSSNLKTVEVKKLKEEPVYEQQKIHLEYPQPISHPQTLADRPNPYRSDALSPKTAHQSASQTPISGSKSGSSSSFSHFEEKNVNSDNHMKLDGDSSPTEKAEKGQKPETLLINSISGNPMFKDTHEGSYGRKQEYAKEHPVWQKSLQKDLREEYGGYNPLKTTSLNSRLQETDESQTLCSQNFPIPEKVPGPSLPDSKAETDSANREEGESVVFRNKNQENQDTEKREEKKAGVKVEETPNLNGQGHAFFKHLKVIGQLKKSYILCENEDGLVIIDQHAAQERYHFEQLQDAFSRPVDKVQPLLVPLRMHVTPDLFVQLDVINEFIEPYGLHFEPFGEDSFILREEPFWLSRLNRSEFLEDMLAVFKSKGSIDITQMNRHMIATAACHSSIRFNRTLCQEEMEQVILDLQKCRQPYHCPHGRPTVITLSEARMRKEFERG